LIFFRLQLRIAPKTPKPLVLILNLNIKSIQRLFS